MKQLKLSIIIATTLVQSAAFAQSSTAVAPTSTAPTNTNTATVAPAPAHSSFSVNYFNYINGPALEEPANGMSINHYLSLKYKTQSKWAGSFTLRPDTNHENGEEKQTVMADPYIRIEYPTLYESAGGTKLTGNVNYFIPSSEASKEAKSNGSITTRFMVAKDIASWSLSYLLIPKFYMWQEKEDGQSTFQQTHYLSASYNLSDKISLDMGVAPTWTNKRNKKTAFNDMPAYPGATINFTKDLSVSPYLEVPLLKAEQKNSSVGASIAYKLL